MGAGATPVSHVGAQSGQLSLAERRSVNKIYADIAPIARRTGYTVNKKAVASSMLRSAHTDDPAHPGKFLRGFSLYVAKVTSSQAIQKGVTAKNFRPFVHHLVDYYDDQYSRIQLSAQTRRLDSFRVLSIGGAALAVFLFLALLLVLAKIERDLDKIYAAAASKSAPEKSETLV